MSHDGDALFESSDSDDTAELIQAAKTDASSSGGRLQKKKTAAAAPKQDDSDDSDKGLFDSDSEEDEPAAKKKIALLKKKPLSKRERLEALASRHRKEPPAAAAVDNVPFDEKKQKGDKGYESGDSYDSANFKRTKEDDDFLDTTGEDADAVNELYAEQRFDDERPDRDGGKKGKKKRKFRDDEAMEDNGEPDNPIMAAVNRMKKKKREKKSFTELEEECKEFLGRMEMAAEDDELAVADRKPATKKLTMLSSVLDMLTRKDKQRMLLDLDLLIVCKRWVQPLPNGTLGNVTVRQRLLEAIAKMTGDAGVTANDLKRSEFGKVVMLLFNHPSESSQMKRQLKALIEQWSRPIFQKSGNMRDLERVHAARGESGLAALSRQQQQVARMAEAVKRRGSNEQDLGSLISSGKKGSGESGINRVQVPFSKGFSYSVRPGARTTSDGPKAARAGPGGKDTRGKLSKRMLEKSRAVGKNQRSANVSIEGRPSKG